MKPFKAIAAMSLNRVIGQNNSIPWHLPEDFKWFKKMTTGHIVVMGRKTFESIGTPLPNRQTIVLTASSNGLPGVQIAKRLEDLATVVPANDPREIYICGGAKVYEHALPLCSDLYLTLVNRTVEGDTFFPPFEERFRLVETISERPEFKVYHYHNKSFA